MHGDRGARRRSGRAGPGLAHPADDLVAQNQRLAQPELADRAVSPVVQVGAVDPAVPDVDGDLPGPR